MRLLRSIGQSRTGVARAPDRPRSAMMATCPRGQPSPRARSAKAYWRTVDLPVALDLGRGGLADVHDGGAAQEGCADLAPVPPRNWAWWSASPARRPSARSCGNSTAASPRWRDLHRPGPARAGYEKYDARAAAMIALLKYGSGIPGYRLEQLQGEVPGMPLPASPPNGRLPRKPLMRSSLPWMN